MIEFRKGDRVTVRGRGDTVWIFRGLAPYGVGLYVIEQEQDEELSMSVPLAYLDKVPVAQ